MQKKTSLVFVVVGDFAVGKTSLTCKFCDGEFPNDVSSTLGIDVKQRNFDLQGNPVLVQIRDSAGQEKFSRVITVSNFRGVDGVVYAYDITSQSSFDQVTTHWYEETKRYASKGLATALVGLKLDLAENRAVSEETARKVAEDKGMLFFETSAKEDVNVDTVFFSMAASLLEKKKSDNIQRATETKAKKNTLDLGSAAAPKKRCLI